MNLRADQQGTLLAGSVIWKRSERARWVLRADVVGGAVRRAWPPLRRTQVVRDWPGPWGNRERRVEVRRPEPDGRHGYGNLGRARRPQASGAREGDVGFVGLAEVGQAGEDAQEGPAACLRPRVGIGARGAVGCSSKAVGDRTGEGTADDFRGLGADSGVYGLKEARTRAAAEGVELPRVLDGRGGDAQGVRRCGLWGHGWERGHASKVVRPRVKLERVSARPPAKRPPPRPSQTLRRGEPKTGYGGVGCVVASADAVAARGRDLTPRPAPTLRRGGAENGLGPGSVVATSAMPSWHARKRPHPPPPLRRCGEGEPKTG
jgi:hypothetical protein